PAPAVGRPGLRPRGQQPARAGGHRPGTGRAPARAGALPRGQPQRRSPGGGQPRPTRIRSQPDAAAGAAELAEHRGADRRSRPRPGRRNRAGGGRGRRSAGRGLAPAAGAVRPHGPCRITAGQPLLAIQHRSSRMSASHKLDQSLESFRRRLKQLTVLQGAAAAGVVLLVVSLSGAWLSAESGFSATIVNVFRLLLVLALAAVLLRFVALPLRHLRRNLAQQVEQRATGFDGRITTYLQLRDSRNPLRDLLAEDALRLSATQPVEKQVEAREFQMAGAIAALTAIILIWLLVAGPGLLGFGLRNLLAGWAVDGMTPPMAIAVTPGDQSVRRGANLRVLAEMDGFDPEEATLHIKSAELEWQALPMQPAGEQFEFTFFFMQE